MWIDKIREALKLAEPVLDRASVSWDEQGHTMVRGARPAWDAVKQALAAIPDEPEMIVLLRWLNERDAGARRRIASCEKQEFVTDDLAWNEGRLNAFVKTIRRIEDMGYKLEGGE